MQEKWKQTNIASIALWNTSPSRNWLSHQKFKRDINFKTGDKNRCLFKNEIKTELEKHEFISFQDHIQSRQWLNRARQQIMMKSLFWPCGGEYQPQSTLTSSSTLKEIWKVFQKVNSSARILFCVRIYNNRADNSEHPLWRIESWFPPSSRFVSFDTDIWKEDRWPGCAQNEVGV